MPSRRQAGPSRTVRLKGAYVSGRDGVEIDEAAPTRSLRARTWGHLRSDRGFWLGAAGFAIFVALAVVGPLLLAHDPNLQYRSEGLTSTGAPVGPSATFPLGTDRLGRDELSRLVAAARLSLVVGLGATLLGTVLGVAVGAVAGFAGSPLIGLSGGRAVRVPVDSILMRATDVMLALPPIMLALALAAVAGPSVGVVIVVVAATLWTSTTRIVYGRVASLGRSDFVEAARALGVGPGRLLGRHVLPHVLPIILVYGALGFAGAILIEATLSYLGVGIPVPDSSWGSMVADNVNTFTSDPRLSLLPGLAVLLTVASVTLLADAVGEALDPRSWSAARTAGGLL